MLPLFDSEHYTISNRTAAVVLRNRTTGTIMCTSGAMKLIRVEKNVAFRFPVASLIQL